MSVQQQRYVGLPSMVRPYCKVLSSGKPLLAPAGDSPPSLSLSAVGVQVKATHLRRYRDMWNS